MYAKSICKANVSRLAISAWWPACLVVLLILATLAGTSMADCNPVGTWQDSEGLMIVELKCDGTVEVTFPEIVVPGYCTLYFDLSGQYSYDPANCQVTFSVEDTQPCHYEDIVLNVTLAATVVMTINNNCDTLEANSSGTVEVCYYDICDTQPFSGQSELMRTSIPFKATNPGPSNGAANQPIDVDLSWSTCGACTFDVYFGTDPTPDSSEFKGNQPGRTYDPGTLSYGTTYYWRIDSKNTNGTTPGYVWSFTSEETSDLWEPDDTSAQANWLGAQQTHSIVPVGDVDWVRFIVTTESEVIIETSGAAGNTRISLYDSSLNEIEYNDDGGTGSFSRIDRFCGLDPLPAGTYYVAIDEYGNDDEIAKYDIILTVTACIPPGIDERLPIFRFWSPVNSRHFYTISESERNKLFDIYPQVWTFEGAVYYVFAADAKPGLLPVYRFWSPVLIAHFYTISESERDKLINIYPHVWTYEGIAFYAYPEGQQPVDTLPVYRFWSPVLETHFYTMNETEKNKLIDNYPHIWTYESTTWYAYE